MNFTIVKDPIPFLIIDNTYNKEELSQIYSEIDFFSDKLEEASFKNSAVKNGKIKENRGLFIDNAFTNRRFSNILRINRKIFSAEVINEICTCHYAYNIYKNINHDSTLLSYYDDGDNYFPHFDTSVITSITWFFKEPKNFTGGEFIFSDYNLNVEVKNNRTVIFFGCYLHEVKEVSIIDKTVPFAGRYALSQFGIIL